jgi:phage terminase large subunit-like protein
MPRGRKPAVKPEYWFDETAATTVEVFFDAMLVHIEGPLAGQPFKLEEWQREIVRELFGWKRTSDNSRKYRKAMIAMSRGNGKSTFAAGLALYLLAVDGEASAKVYSAAADRGQAAIVYETAEKMVAASKYLSKRIKPYRTKRMVYGATGSRYEVLSADAYTKHGLNPSAIVFDELHAQPNRDLYDVLTTAMGKRKQPMMIMITTAGYDKNSICYEQYEYAKGVLDGTVDDPTFFARIWEAEEGDDWTSPAVWAKANPNYGISVRPDFLAQECKTALASPAYQNTFRRLYLNQWVSAESRWIDMAWWDKCNVALPDLAGRVCFAGLDLASTTDIAALVLVFPPLEEGEPYWVLPKFWIPADGMIERVRRDKVPYDVWVRNGLIVATAGNVIDYTYIEEEIKTAADVYDLQEVAFDRWGAVQISQNLEAAGITMVGFGQGMASMSAPTKALLHLVLSQRIAHGGNAVLRWMADGMTVTRDAADNLKPDKSKSTRRIDGIVATIMGLDRAQRYGAGAAASVYEERGVLSL